MGSAERQRLLGPQNEVLKIAKRIAYLHFAGREEQSKEEPDPLIIQRIINQTSQALDDLVVAQTHLENESN